MIRNRINKFLLLIIIAQLIVSCSNRQHVDLLITRSHIQLMDSALTVVEAMAIDKGKVVATGSNDEILKLYESDSVKSFPDKFIYPGLIDAHCHFYGLGLFNQMADLTGATSFDDAVELCMKFYSRQPGSYLLGRGWDQNKWPGKQYPDNRSLNQAFPDIPVLLKRIDGHAAIANEAALKLAGITLATRVAGGEVLVKNGKVTGVLIDNAVDLVERVMPAKTRGEQIKALKNAERICFEYGLTSVTDAGLERDVINLIDSLQQTGYISIRINAMVSISEDNLDYYLANEPINKDRLRVASFKMYADGALGSRGACLKQPYSDQANHYGLLLTEPAQMESYIRKLANSKFQLCTHAIGDSTNFLVLALYRKYNPTRADRRWRIEHAQVINPTDFNLFGESFTVPSVQPTHATSDMTWAFERLGATRLKSAYAYKILKDQLGWIPLGTDFPVESVSPFYTFYSAVARKDADGNPPGGFQPENALTRREALMGVTTWAAKGAFQENSMGSLLPGTFADFVVLDADLLKHDLSLIRNLKSFATYVNGVGVSEFK